MKVLCCLGLLLGLAGLAAGEEAPNVYVDNDCGFRLRVPDGWKVSQIHNDSKLLVNNEPAQELGLVNPASPQDKVYLWVTAFRGHQVDLFASSEETRAFINGSLKGQIVSERDLQIGGLPAHQMVYVATSKGTGTPRKYIHTLLSAGATLYVLHGVSSVDGYPKYEAGFNAIADSFRVDEK